MIDCIYSFTVQLQEFLQAPLLNWTRTQSLQQKKNLQYTLSKNEKHMSSILLFPAIFSFYYIHYSFAAKTNSEKDFLSIYSTVIGTDLAVRMFFE
jgi:hypothetical protein